MRQIKSNLLLAIITIVVFSFSACKNDKKGHDHAKMEVNSNISDVEGKGENTEGVTFKEEHIKIAFQNYVNLRDALTDTKADRAKSSAIMLVNSLTKLVDGKRANDAAKVIASTDDIEMQRIAFSDLSEELVVLLEGNITSGELYLAHCPMAKNNSGANWISNSNEIMNPYFGDKMMKCGYIKNTLN